MLLGLLEDTGLTNVEAISSGLEAIGEVARNKPDLIFLDIKMPEIDGWLLCEMFSSIKRWKDVPVILQSGLVGRENIKKGLSLGAHSYIEKPVTQDKVAAVLAAIFKAPIVYPQDISNRMRFAVQTIAEMTKQTFNLVLGSQTQIDNVEHIRDGSTSSTYDFQGTLRAEGAAQIEVSVGWQRALTINVCSAFLGIPEDELDDELLIDGLSELLNVMFGTTFKDLASVYPVRLGLPESHQNKALKFAENAEHKFLIEFTTRDGSFPLKVSINENVSA
jgi:CheY-like chemotaxis protein